MPACLESLRTQSLRDAEFLLVDDASPDGAGAVLAEYARRDSRFRVLTHSQNRGLFAARMTGADAATGKYLAFLDSDDFVSVDFYRAAVALALAESLAYAAASGWATPVAEFETKGVARFEELDARVEATAKARHDAARKAECAAEELRRDGVPL